MTEPAILAGSPLLYLLLVAIGLATGAYGTTVGLGGGIILVPVLLWLFPGTPPEILTGTSLAVVLLNAISGTLAYARQGRIDYRSGALFAAATIPGAVIGVWLVRYITTSVFSAVFGSLLLAISALIIRRPRAQNQSAGNPRGILAEYRGRPGYRVRRALGTGLSFTGGFIAGILGVGGGFIHVPMMTYVLRAPIHIATATSQFILIFTSAAGIFTHLALNTGFGGWQIVLSLALGIIPGAQLGALLSRRLQSTLIIRLLAMALIILGARLVF